VDANAPNIAAIIANLRVRRIRSAFGTTKLKPVTTILQANQLDQLSNATDGRPASSSAFM
jgi:hypothetical protein